MDGKKILLTLVMGLSLSMAAEALAMGLPAKVLGKWYDASGQVVLDIREDTVNGCPVEEVAGLAGGSSDFSCRVKIREAAGLRELPLVCESLQKDSWHAHVFLGGDPHRGEKGRLLSRTPEPLHYESVGGIGLDTPTGAVEAAYGIPDRLERVQDRNVTAMWWLKNGSTPGWDWNCSWKNKRSAASGSTGMGTGSSTGRAWAVPAAWKTLQLLTVSRMFPKPASSPPTPSATGNISGSTTTPGASS